MNKIFYAFVFLQMLLAKGFASEDCFKNHLSEAIQLNEKRRTLYSELSHGQSEFVSNHLIFSEKMLLFFGKLGFFNFDSLFNDELRYGLKITCDIFVKMDTVPPFKESFENGPPLKTSPLASLVELNQHIHFALSKKDLEKTHELLISKLEELNTEPRLNCMSRHILESMAHITSLYPGWLKQIQSKQSQDEFTTKIIHLLKSHLYAFPQIEFIDSKARAFNLSGLPLICQDVPRIPLVKDAYEKQ